MNINNMDIFDDSYFDECCMDDVFESTNIDYDVFAQTYDNAFESGYIQAMLDAGYDYDSAMENKTSIAAGAAALTGISDLIYSFIKSGKIKSSTVISVPNMIKNGMSKADAIKNANKAVKFFIARGYVSDNVSKLPINDRYELKMSDLTDSGKMYMKSYYDACDKITEYDAETGARKILKLSGTDTKEGGALIGSTIGMMIGGAIASTAAGATGIGSILLMSSGVFLFLERAIGTMIHQAKLDKQGKVINDFAQDLMIDKITK